MSRTALKEVGARPRATRRAPCYPALLCAAVALASAGCAGSAEDAPEGGPAEDGAVDQTHNFAEASVGDASEDAAVPEEMMAGCSAGAYHRTPGWLGPALIAGAVVLFRRR